MTEPLLHQDDVMWTLRRGEPAELEGCRFRPIPGDIGPGDWYVAMRNTGPHLLTCHEVNHDGGWIVPVEPKYCFNIGECVRVELVEDES